MSLSPTILDYNRLKQLMPSTNLTMLSPKTKSFTKQKKINIFPVKHEHYNPPN